VRLFMDSGVLTKSSTHEIFIASKYYKTLAHGTKHKEFN
jgi:hypothetical protein